MKVAIPGIAFGALKDSDFPKDSPDLWHRVEKYSIQLTQGRGLSVHIDLDQDDLQIIRERLRQMNWKLGSKPYPVRGLEGNITMQSIGIALGRLDDALRDRVPSDVDG